MAIRGPPSVSSAQRQLRGPIYLALSRATSDQLPAPGLGGPVSCTVPSSPHPRGWRGLGGWDTHQVFPGAQTEFRGQPLLDCPCGAEPRPRCGGTETRDAAMTLHLHWAQRPVPAQPANVTQVVREHAYAPSTAQGSAPPPPGRGSAMRWAFKAGCTKEGPWELACPASCGGAPVRPPPRGPCEGEGTLSHSLLQHRPPWALLL